MADRQLPLPPVQHGNASEIPVLQIEIKGVQPTAPPGQREEWHGRYPYPQPILPRWQPIGPQVPYLWPNFRGFGDEPRAQPLQTHVPQAQPPQPFVLPSLPQTLPPEPLARVRVPEGSEIPKTTGSGLRFPVPNAASSTSDPTKARCKNCGVLVDQSQWHLGIHHEADCVPCGPHYATVRLCLFVHTPWLIGSSSTSVGIPKMCATTLPMQTLPRRRHLCGSSRRFLRSAAAVRRP